MAAKKAVTKKAAGKKSNRKKFEEIGLIHPKTKLSADQRTALDSLTPEEVDAVASAHQKLKSSFRSETTAFGLGMMQGHLMPNGN